MALYNKKDKKKTLEDIYTIFFSKLGKYSDKDNYHPHRIQRDTTLIRELLSTLYKQPKRKDKEITHFPTKGTSQYHR